jgi:CRP-like cAMP-binding protein
MAKDARFIGPVDRILYLQSSANLGALPADDLYSMALNLTERYFKKGTPLLSEGRVVDRVFFLVEGQVTLRRAGRLYRTLTPPGTAGLLAALSRNPAGTDAYAEEDTLALEMSIDDLWNVTEESFELLIAMLRELTREMAELQRRMEVAGALLREDPLHTPYPDRPLDLVQRLVVLRRGGPFQSASLNALAELAERAVELRLDPGTVLWREGDKAEYGLNIVHGVVSCVGDGGRRRFRMGPGSALGTLETLAQLPRSYEAVTETPVVALRGNMEIVLDTLEDNAELGRAFLGFLAGALDKLYERTAVELAAQGPDD